MDDTTFFIAELGIRIKHAEQKYGAKDERVVKLKKHFYFLTKKEWAKEEVVEIKEETKKEENVPPLIYERIDEIHELTVENIMRTQATEFYTRILGSCPLIPEEIKKQLIEDMIAMERHRRRNDFAEFSQSVFRQIEGVVNYLWANGKIIERIIAIRKETWLIKKKYYTDNTGRNIEQIQSFGTKTVQDMILNLPREGYKSGYYNDNDYDTKFSESFIPTSDWWNKLDDMCKVRSILYCIYFNEQVTYDKNFTTIRDSIYEIKQMRNLTHRGGNTTTPNQQEKMDSAQQKQYQNYIAYQNVLLDFMEKVFSSPNLSRFL